MWEKDLLERFSSSLYEFLCECVTTNEAKPTLRSTIFGFVLSGVMFGLGMYWVEHTEDKPWVFVSNCFMIGWGCHLMFFWYKFLFCLPSVKMREIVFIATPFVMLALAMLVIYGDEVEIMIRCLLFRWQIIQ